MPRKRNLLLPSLVLLLFILCLELSATDAERTRAHYPKHYRTLKGRRQLKKSKADKGNAYKNGGSSRSEKSGGGASFKATSADEENIFKESASASMKSQQPTEPTEPAPTTATEPVSTAATEAFLELGSYKSSRSSRSSKPAAKKGSTPKRSQTKYTMRSKLQRESSVSSSTESYDEVAMPPPVPPEATTPAPTEEPVELVPFECPNIPETSFVSFLYVDFVGDASALTETETTTLNTAVMEAYNEQIVLQCDSYVRTVTAVALGPNPMYIASEDEKSSSSDSAAARRQLQTPTEYVDLEAFATEIIAGDSSTTSNDDLSIYRALPYVFQMSATCLGCPISEVRTHPLFSDFDTQMAEARRHGGDIKKGLKGLSKQSHTLSAHLAEYYEVEHHRSLADSDTWQQQEQHRNLQTNTTTNCSCPANLSPDEPRAPSEDAFFVVLNQDIHDLVAAGNLTSVTGLAQLYEFYGRR